MVERRPEEPRVGGPIPPRSTAEKKTLNSTGVSLLPLGLCLGTRIGIAECLRSICLWVRVPPEVLNCGCGGMVDALA